MSEILTYVLSKGLDGQEPQKLSGDVKDAGTSNMRLDIIFFMIS